MDELDNKQLELMYGKVQGEDKNRLILRTNNHELYIINTESGITISYERILPPLDPAGYFRRTGELYYKCADNSFVRINECSY
jgi:hypothetical protein